MEIRDIATVLVANQDCDNDVFTLADAAEYMHEQIVKARQYEEEARAIFQSATNESNFGGVRWKFYRDDFMIK